MDFDDLKVIGQILGLLVFSIYMFLLVGCWANNTFIENIPSVVKVNGKIVYKGISAGYDIGSSGANTTVTVLKPWMYLFPKAYYVSKDVEVINTEVY